MVEKRRVQIVSERGTPYAKPVTTTDSLAREERQLVRRYPRKVYYDLYVKREPEPATTVKESTVKITKVTTFDSLADAIAHAKAVGTDAPTSTVISFSQTTTIAVPEVSGTPSATTDTAATPTATGTTTSATVSATGSVTPVPTDPSVIPTGAPTATTTETPLPTTTGTGSVTPTPTDPSVIPTVTPTATTTTGSETTPAPTATGTPTPRATHTPTSSGTDTPPTTATGVPSAPKPSGLAQRDIPEMLPGLKSLSDKLHAMAPGPNSLTGALTSSRHPLDPAVTLSGWKLASSGVATLASAMKRRLDPSDHLNK